MSFSLDTYFFPKLANYEAAKQHFDDCKPWRNGDENVRPLEKRSKRHCAMIRGSNEQYVCRLYNTDLVTYWPNGRIEVNLNYQSVSSEAFINALLRPTGLGFIVNCSPPTVWQKNEQSYYARGYLVEGDVAVLQRSDDQLFLLNRRPIKIPTLDKKKAAALRNKSGYTDFTAWRKAYEAMRGDAPRSNRYRFLANGWTTNRVPYTEILHMLLVSEKWPTLADCHDNEYILNSLYMAHPEVIQFVTKEAFENYREWDNVRKLDRKYGWAL
jgi:hypothetical protein